MKEEKAILIHYQVVVYEISCIPSNSKATDSIFCGSEEERAPASVFRHYFYEKWAANYNGCPSDARGLPGHRFSRGPVRAQTKQLVLSIS